MDGKKMGMVVGLLVATSFFPAIGVSSLYPFLTTGQQIAESAEASIDLPPPENLDRAVEEALARRMSIREFTPEGVSDQDLSTVLWAAYGLTDGGRAVNPVDGHHAAVIYVLRQDAIYRYDPLNHSLVLYKEGDYRHRVAQYTAPVQLGLTWDLTVSTDENASAAEMGAIGQNIQFAANALGLGTVVTAEIPSPLDTIGLPPHHTGRIVMPLGHPLHPYYFVNRPLWISFLPRIAPSQVSLTAALGERSEATSWSDTPLSRENISHLLWAAYGYSYYLDKSEQGNNPVKRHRTVPSAHGYYPFHIYAVTADHTSRYFGNVVPIDLWGLPIVTFLWPVCGDDNREAVADASAPYVSQAPLLIIPVLSVQKTVSWDDLSALRFRWVWTYEAGAMAHNVLLEATARGLAGNIAPVTDKEALCLLLHLDSEHYDPMMVIPVGYA